MNLNAWLDGASHSAKKPSGLYDRRPSRSIDPGQWVCVIGDGEFVVMQNLLAETTRVLNHNGKGGHDVKWVGAYVGRYSEVKYFAKGTWEEFAALANFEYDNGYGGNQINSHLVVVGDNWWLERHEYDGSEWWEFKTLPTYPDNTMVLNPDSLRERW